jgi:methylenetetrahydrofolate reductase (NADPH)
MSIQQPPPLAATPLTSRERDVLRLRAEGKSAAEAAAALMVQPRTVKFHLRNVYAKLGIGRTSPAARQLALLRAWQALQTHASGVPEVAAAPAVLAMLPVPAGAAGRQAFRTDRKLTQVLARGRFTLSAEVMPPRNGADQAMVLAQVQRLVAAGVQFLAVTKGAGGSLRGGSLPIAQAIKEQFGVPCIAHFTCRDLLPEEVENQLMDHHYFGIRNILALRGDPPDGDPCWQARPGGHQFAHQLIAQIRQLNQGRYLPRRSLRAGPPTGQQLATDFCIGAAVYPEHPDPAERIDFFKQKVDAGAQFAITQMVFDAGAFGRFMDRCEHAGLCGSSTQDVPVLPGTRILRSRSQARRTAEKFGVSVPRPLLDALPPTFTPGDAAADAHAIDLFLSLVERLRRLGAPGIHLFVTDPAIACAALSHLTAK